MRRFVRDVRGRFTEVRHDPEVEEIMAHIRPADPEPDDMRPMTEAEARLRLARLMNDPTLPWYHARRREEKRTELPVRPAEPEPRRIMSEAECRARIEQMKRSGTLPTFEEFHRVVEDVLDELDAKRGDEPRERITPRRVKRILS
jgi:hypothetical protein